MATIRKLRGKWQGQVRRKGLQPRAKSFDSKADAEKWARSLEAELDRCGSLPDTRLAEKMTVRELLERYVTEITPAKRSASSETYRIRGMLTRPICYRTLALLTPADVAKYRDERLAQVASSTVIRELNTLGQASALGLGLASPERQRSGPVKREDPARRRIGIRVIAKLDLGARRDVFEANLSTRLNEVARHVVDVAGRLIGKARERLSVGLRFNDATKPAFDEQRIVDGPGCRLELANRNARSSSEVHLVARLNKPSTHRKLTIDAHSCVVFRMECRPTHGETVSEVVFFWKPSV